MLSLTQLTDVTNAVRHNLSMFLTFSEKKRFLLTMTPAELKSHSYGTEVPSYLLSSAFWVMRFNQRLSD